MDSINANQPEHNRHDLRGREAIERIEQTVKQAHTCFFCTGGGSVEPGSVRPMSVREVDDAGNLWFLSADDSHKNLELAQDAEVTLFFQGSPHSDFLFLKGRASVTRDHERIRELWSPLIKTWFTEGVNDPRITAIKVAPIDGYYWDNQHGAAIAGAKMLVGAALGKTLDDSIEGSVRP